MVLAIAPAGAAAVAPRAHSAVAKPASSPLPWIADDWPRALAVARQKKLPIFVENWAPW
jgi:hypothetical protein